MLSKDQAAGSRMHVLDWLDGGTFIPSIHFNKDFFAMLVAVIGTTLSAYLYSWQSNQDVEEDISMGRRRLTDRLGTTRAELRRSQRDVAFGMLFSAAIAWRIIRWRRPHLAGTKSLH